MEPIQYLRLLRRRWRLLAACVVVAAVAGWVTTPSANDDRVVTFNATTTLLRDSSTAQAFALPTVALFVQTGDVPVRVVERLGLSSSPQSVADGLDVELDEISGSLRITARGSSGAAAAELANAFAQETLSYLASQAQSAVNEALADVDGRIRTLEAEVADLEGRVDEAEAAGAPTAALEAQRDSKARQYALALDEQQRLENQPPPTSGYVVLETATPESASVDGSGFEAPRSRAVRVAIAVFLGFVLGVGVVVAADRLDPRLFSRAEIERAFGLPVVAEIPFGRRSPSTIVTVEEPSSAAAEAYRGLRAALVLTPTEQLGARNGETSTSEPTVILVTSPAPGDGKTTTVANLAAGYAEAGRSVLVLGCDFRRPEIHKYFGVNPIPGLADAMEGDTAVDLAAIVRDTTVPGVQLAPSGSRLANPGEVAAEGRSIVAAARRWADVVLIDTAPMLAANDAVELMTAADAVVIVARAGQTTSEAAARTREVLDRMAAPVLGTVLIGAPGADATSAYYGYYGDEEPARPRVRRGRRRGGPRAATKASPTPS